MPAGGVKAGGACFELYVLGVLNADPSESAAGTCGTPSPLGSANSDVVEDSSSTGRGLRHHTGGRDERAPRLVRLRFAVFRLRLRHPLLPNRTSSTPQYAH